MKVTNDTFAEVSGTCLVGTINATFGQLVNAFGLPTVTGAATDKTQSEWFLTFTDGAGATFVATVYDWKRYVDTPPVGRYTWHVGGHDERALLAVANSLDLRG